MKILIVSGAGILAGTHTYNTLVEKLVKLQKIKSDKDFPEVVLYNYPFKSIQDDGYLDVELAKKELAPILEKFSDFDHIIIACNTFHLLDLNIKNILSLPEYAIQEFQRDKEVEKKALVLCSAYSREHNLFNSENIHYPNQAINDLTDRIISDNIYSYKNYHKENFNELNHLISEGKYTHLMIGCTELSMIEWQKMVRVKVIDSVDITIKAIVKIIEKELNESIQ